MKAVAKSKSAQGAELKEVEVPKIMDNEVLVKVKHAAICGTDVHIYQWNEWASHRVKPPIIMGHEFVGKVVETGKNVESVFEGEFVSAESHIVCGKCLPCKSCQMHLCENTKILGVDTNGVFAEYAVIPEFDAWKVQKGIPLEFAAVQEPLGNSVHAVFENNVPANTIAIFGAGPTGLFAIGIAKKIGAQKVIVVEKSDYRINIAKKMGADRTIKVGEEDIVKAIKDETNGKGVDIAIEMSGSLEALYNAIKSLRNGGELTLFGLPDKKAEIDIAEDLIFRGIQIHSIIGRKLFDTWIKSTGLLKGGLDLSPVITHKLKLDEFDKGMELMIKRESGKVLLSP